MGSTKTLKIVGVLFILATGASVAGMVILQSLIRGSGYLKSLYTKETWFGTGVLFYFLSDVSVIGIGVLMFPIMKKYNEVLAFSYLSSRLVEALVLIIGGISLLLLINISQAYVKEPATLASYYESLAALVKTFQGLCYEIGFFATGLGGILLCYMLLTTRLIPQSISALGVLGYTVLFVKSLLDVLGYNTAFVLFIPVALFELIFPIWIITKGFNNKYLRTA